MGVYILYIDIAYRWGRAKLAYFRGPAEIKDWFKRFGYTQRPHFTIGKGAKGERYIVAIAAAPQKLITMSYHLDRLIAGGGDDFVTSMAYACEADIKRWAQRGTATRACAYGRSRLAATGGAGPVPPRAGSGAAGVAAGG
jgi:hypothetical protein